MFEYEKLEDIKSWVGDVKYNLIEKFITQLKIINSEVNLISRKDIDFLFEHHILHSLLIAKIFTFKPTETIIDIGTGGGFPGIPLAIYFDQNNFTLIDSINKKINKITEIINILDLKNVKTECTRAENIKTKFDIILGRGVKDINLFFNFTKHLLKKTSKIIYLNGINDKLDTKEGIETKYYNLSSITNNEYYKTKQIVEIKIK